MRLVRVQPYKKLVKEALKSSSDYAKEFINAITPHIKQRGVKKGRIGDLKKRDIRSNRQRQKINDAINTYISGKKQKSV